MSQRPAWFGHKGYSTGIVFLEYVWFTFQRFPIFLLWFRDTRSLEAKVAVPGVLQAVAHNNPCVEELT